MVLREGGRDAVVLIEGVREVEVGAIAVWSHLDRACPERDAVGPIHELAIGRDGEKDQYAQRRPRDERPRQQASRLGSPERQRDEEADVRQVGVAIRVGLGTDLHEPDDGNEHPHEPEPPDDQIGRPSSQSQRTHRQGDEKHRGECRLCPGDCGQRVEGGEIGRPNGLTQIDHSGNHGVFDSGDERKLIGADNGQALTLGEEGHHARDSAEDQQRHLFGGQTSPRGGPDPVERPDVQEQQRERQRDQHRLDQQACREERRHQDVPADRRTGRVSGVGGHRQHRKEAAEHVLTLGDPRDRFDVQRMNREECRRERARAHTTRHPAQDQKQHADARDVEQQVDHVRRTGCESEELAVHHVRDPRQRMPVGGVLRRECPADAAPAQTGNDFRILVDVVPVVEVDEVEVCDAGVDQRGTGGQ